MTDRVYRRVQAVVYVGTHDGGPGIRLSCGHLYYRSSWEEAQALRGERVPCMYCEVEREQREVSRG